MGHGVKQPSKRIPIKNNLPEIEERRSRGYWGYF